MPYISLDNLTQYNGRLRDYIDGSFDKLDGANWRKTSAAQSVSCWPIPESPLEPEVTFKFSETPPASGTKGPDNPSTIVGVEAVACHVCEAAGVNDTPYFIGLGDTYYGGSVNFATGVMEVTHERITLDGNTTFLSPNNLEQTDTYTLYVYPTKSKKQNTITQDDIASNTMTVRLVSTNNGWYPGILFVQGWAGIPITLLKSELELQNGLSVSDVMTAFNNWFSSHPMSFIYPIATPYTVPLTPVLVRSLPALSHYVPRQNTIYTPHESVQVGYAKSALKTSEELTNAIISLGGNV